MVLVCVMMMVALLAPLLAPYSPVSYLSKMGLVSWVLPRHPVPSFHWALTTWAGMCSAVSSMPPGFPLKSGSLPRIVSVAVGTLLGVMAGFWGGWVDLVIMRFTDAMLAFPFLLFVILVVSVLKPSVTIIFVVIGLLGWAKTARVARGQTLSVMQNHFIDAARVAGASSWRIIFHHIIPNIMGPLIVLTTLQVGNYILTEGALSYIGAGVPQPIPSWGSMIYTGQQYYQTAPWLMLYPGLMLTLTVIGFNLVGDGLDAALNPRN